MPADLNTDLMCGNFDVSGIIGPCQLYLTYVCLIITIINLKIINMNSTKSGFSASNTPYRHYKHLEQFRKYIEHATA